MITIHMVSPRLKEIDICSYIMSHDTELLSTSQHDVVGARVGDPVFPGGIVAQDDGT